MEQIRPQIKAKDEVICSKEAHLMQSRNESKLIQTSLHKARAALAAEIAQCKSLEKQLTQKSNEVELAKLTTSESSDPGVEGGEKQLEQLELELEGMKKRHRKQIITIQSLWKEGKGKKKEFIAHSSMVDPLEEEFSQVKNAFREQREALLEKLQHMYDLLTPRNEQVSSTASIMIILYTFHNAALSLYRVS